MNSQCLCYPIHVITLHRSLFTDYIDFGIRYVNLQAMYVAIIIYTIDVLCRSSSNFANSNRIKRDVNNIDLVKPSTWFVQQNKFKLILIIQKWLLPVTMFFF